MEPTVIYKLNTATKDFTEAVEKAAYSTQGLADELHEFKKLQRRRLIRIITYWSLFMLMILVLFLKIHWLAKVGYELALLVITFLIWAMDNPRPNMSHDERILQEEYERRG